MKRSIIILLVMISMILVSCEEDLTQTLLFVPGANNSGVESLCLQNNTYCHLIRREGGISYLNFSNTTGNLTYRVD